MRHLRPSKYSWYGGALLSQQSGILQAPRTTAIRRTKPWQITHANTRDDQAGHGQPQYHGVPANALPLTASEDRQWATLAHFGGILGCVPSLLIYLIFKDRGPFTAQESKEALNFTPAAHHRRGARQHPGVHSRWWATSSPSSPPLIWIALTCFSVAAGIHVNRGQPHRYEFNLRWIK